MAIIANDLTLGYFNFTLGFPTKTSAELLQTESCLNPVVSSIDEEFINEIKKDKNDNEWDINANWN
jgi:hypothetical protein